MLIAVMLPLGNAQGQNANGKFDATESGRQLDRISRDLDLRRHDRDQLKDWAQNVQRTKRDASECVTAAQQNLDKANKDLETLGAPIKGEPADVTQQRRALKRQISDDEKRIASCKLLVLRSDDIASRISAIQQQILAERLFATGPTVSELVQDYWQQPEVWYAAGRTAFLKNTGLQLLSTNHLLTLVALLAIGVAVGIWLRRRIGTRLCLRRETEGAATPTLFGRIGMCLLTLFGHYLPYFLATSVAAVYFYFITGALTHAPLISVIAYGLPVYFLLIAAIRFFLDPFPPAAPLHSLPTDVAKSLGRRLRVLVLLIFLAYLLFSTLLTQGLPETAVELLRAVIGAVFILNLIWIVWLLGRIPRLAHTLGLRSGLILVLAASVVAEWLGYRNLSLYLLRAILGTIVALGITLLLGRLVRELFDVIDSTRHPWQQWLHQRLGLKPGQKIPGLIWLRLVAFILLWGGFVLATLRIWGLSETSLQQLAAMADQGFAVGSLRIIPTKILLAIVGLIIFLTVNSWFKGRLEQRWLPKTRMDRGAREALVAISGYTGVALAIVIALAVAGMDFSNLAIIAGALSVGIGFGLQNIVNNFVSGLILLFERPVKTGDWVVVGNTEGYVRRISIRSTQIQTFDRADVIVPNSELISNQVTNWMLRDPRGRVRVPIGVAYGSDTQLVKEILLKLANEHPLVVTDKSTPQPMVLFRGFGDSSLDFELRCFISNIDKRLTVISDLNFGIDQAFRENNVEIPFPQRDLHVRNWPPSGRPPAPPPDADD